MEINLTQPGRVRKTAFLAGVYPQLYSTLAIWSDTQVLNLVRKFYVVSSECAYLGYIPIAIAILNDYTRYQALPGNAYPEALPPLSQPRQSKYCRFLNYVLRFIAFQFCVFILSFAFLY